MGSPQSKPADFPGICPLCSRECRNQVTLRCTHAFCQGCIGELWSASTSGPYYCPECNYEYRNLPDFDGASTSIGAHTNWAVGKRFAERYSPKKILGKRKFSSVSFGQNSRGYTLGRATSSNSSVTSDLSDDDVRPKKKKVTEPPPSGSQGESPVCDTSSGQAAQQTNSTSSTNPSCSESLDKNPVRDVRAQNPQPSCSGTETQQPEPGPSVSSCPKESWPKPGKQTGSHPTLVLHDKSLESSKTSNAAKETSSYGGSFPCHYCSSQEQRPAVKTCLVCGASMCMEHLKAHLESPVFKSHPLVPAVEDVMAWRCQEHQEMNRIFCRPCGVCVCTVCTVIGSHKDHACISIKEAEKELRASLKSEMKKLQTKETAFLNRVTELNEKKRGVEEVVEGARAAVVQQYQAIREALELEEQHALCCVDQEQSRVVGSIEKQLQMLNHSLKNIQSTFNSLQTLADIKGAAGVQDQAFIMEYQKIAEGLNGLVDDGENLETVEKINQGRIDCLQKWAEKRLETVVISVPHSDVLKLLYGSCPTLDPDTAHPKLLLSMENRHVEYSEAQQPYPDDEARFTIFPQVLGSKAMSQGRHYWEVEVCLDEGRWKVGICDGQISRKGQKDSCRIGFYPNSWCLVCEKGKVEALHNKVSSPVCSTGLQKVGILLDFEEGSLTFYSVVEDGTLTLLYSFQHEFSELLYPALAVSKTQLTICDLFVTSTTN